jgi:hypothetical protein
VLAYRDVARKNCVQCPRGDQSYSKCCYVACIELKENEYLCFSSIRLKLVHEAFFPVALRSEAMYFPI